MTKIFNNFNNYSVRIIKALVPSFSGMLSVKAGRPLVKWILQSVLLVKGSITTSLVKVSVYYVRFLYNLTKRSGIKYTVKYLKACTSLLMQSISGKPHKSTQELGAAVSRTSKGLPRVIPILHRNHITKGNVFYIRFWLTLFSIYRVLDYTGKLSIKTIIKPSNAVFDVDEVRAATLSFMENFDFPYIDRRAGYSELDIRPYWISTTSPNSTKQEWPPGSPKTTSSHLYSIIGSYLGMNYTGMIKKVLNLRYALGDSYSNVSKVVSASRFALRKIPWYLLRRKTKNGSDIFPIEFTYLGRLGFKLEPAGKVRVFAMVDCLTQWMLRPLHIALSSRLKGIPMDATHDQDGSLRTYVEMLRREGITEVYSFDLSAATDRLPVKFQALILDIVTNYDGFGMLWSAALVDRWYKLPTPHWGASTSLSALGLKPESIDPNYVRVEDVVDNRGRTFKAVTAVRYAVGQPMGALSSWVMLALAHHIIVQMAALRVGWIGFDKYRILGDDGSIANKEVAYAYLDIMKELDVEINLSKSIISSNGSLEFAKRFFYNYQEVTGIPFLEMAVSKYDVRGLIQLFSRIQNWRPIRVSELLSFLGHGYKALSRITTKYSKMSKGMKSALQILSFPGGLFSTLESVQSWILSPSFNKGGLRSMPESGLKYLLDIIRSRADTVAKPDLPETPEDFEVLWNNTWFGQPEEPNNLDDIVRDLQFVKHDIKLMYYDEMCYSLHLDWDTTLTEVKDTFDLYHEDPEELPDFDTLWSYLSTLEDIAAGENKASEFVEVSEVISINKSVLLKRLRKIQALLQESNENKD
jgi:hypothetical protein